MDMRRMILLISLVIILLVVSGCTPQATPANVARARWNPNYWERCLANIVAREDVLWRLSWRSDFDDYWRLVNLVTERSPLADYVVIVERVVGDSEDGYWFALLVQDRKGIYCYTNKSYPLSDLAPHKGKSVPVVDYPVWGKIQNTRDARGFFEFLDDRGIWHTEQRVYVYIEEDSASEKITKPKRKEKEEPWAEYPEGESVFDPDSKESAPSATNFHGSGALLTMVHIYRARDQAFASFAVEEPVLDSTVIFGVRDLGDVRKRCYGPDSGEIDDLDWEIMNDKQRAVWRKHYEKTYPVRIILNGVMRILYQQCPKIVEIKRNRGTGTERQVP